MMDWIEEILSYGIRRPGYDADEKVSQWAAERLEFLGLEDVRLEPLELPRWDPDTATLAVASHDQTFTGFALPYTGIGTVEGELTPAKGGGVGGRIAVMELRLSVFPQSTARALATSLHDPDGDFESLEQTLPFDMGYLETIDALIADGVSGFVGLLTGFPWETRDYYAPYDAIHRPVPALWLSGADGRRLLELMDGPKPVTARINVRADQSTVASHNVIGTLPGAASDEWVIVASHHDAPWASAVEDASGFALVLAQAAYWAGVPVQERPHNMMFLLTAGHMTHAAGTRAFIDSHRDLLERTVLEVHLEHTARRCIGKDAELMATDEPEVRWWFTSRNPRLEVAVHEAIVGEDLRRSLIYRPDVFSPMPPTDAAFFHPEGVPLVSFLTAPMYLFDSRDTIDKIHEPSLEPVSRAAIKIIQSTRGISAGQMRAGVVTG